MFNLQANAYEIANGIKEDLDMQICKLGLTITDFMISSFSYPEEIQKMQTKAASQSMVGDMNKYSQMAMADSLEKGGGRSNIAGDMMSMQMGMAIGQQMMNNMNQANTASGMPQAGTAQIGNGPKFCPECGTPVNGAKFCPNCGKKLIG